MKLILNRKSLFVGVASPRLLAYFAGRSAVDGKPAIVLALAGSYGWSGKVKFSRVYHPFGGKN